MPVQTIQTVNKYDYIGLSTDEKPVDKVTNGAFFVESDTRNIYRFLEGTWYLYEDGVPYVWNTSLLQKERLQQPTIEAGTIDVRLATVEDLLEDIKDNTTGIGGTGGTKTTRLVESGNYTYVGKADIGSSESSAVWSIFRIDETSGLVILWADGNDNEDNVWNDYATKSYS